MIILLELAWVLGMYITHLYPRALQTCARPMPVFPAVPSTTVPPGLILTPTVNALARGPRTEVNLQSLFFGVPNESESGTILHTTTGILEFCFSVDFVSRLL